MTVFGGVPWVPIPDRSRDSTMTMRVNAVTITRQARRQGQHPHQGRDLDQPAGGARLTALPQIDARRTGSMPAAPT